MRRTNPTHPHPEGLLYFLCTLCTFLQCIDYSRVSLRLSKMTELLEGYYKAVDHFFKFVKVWSQNEIKVSLSLLSRSRGTGRERRMTVLELSIK